MLYETQCSHCHSSHLHMREAPRAKTVAQIREQVERWSSMGRTAWTEEEFVDVTAWLNQTFYRLPCAAPHC